MKLKKIILAIICVMVLWFLLLTIFTVVISKTSIKMVNKARENIEERFNQYEN